MVPNSRSLRKVAEIFLVSKSTIQKARLLQDEKGIAEYLDLLKRPKLTEETINKIKGFYCDDEFSRQLPGKKDSVSIGRNNHYVKRLLLCNLKELYATYKCTYPEDKISFLKFASLRPKWCTLVGPKGSHSVCACTIHQNLKLMLSAIGLEKSYHTLTEKIISSRESKICMIHPCENCQGVENVERFLYDYLNPNDPNDTDDGREDDAEERSNLNSGQWLIEKN